MGDIFLRLGVYSLYCLQNIQRNLVGEFLKNLLFKQVFEDFDRLIVSGLYPNL